MKFINKHILILSLGIILYSCNDVLDEVPDNRTQIDNAEKIGELLTGAYATAGYVPFIEPRSDNAEDKGPGAGEAEYNLSGYRWDDNATSTGSDFPANFWNGSYEAISQANQALKSIEELEISDPNNLEIRAYKGEALIARAYAHFMLVNIWSKTYDPQTASTDLGIPYVTEPENVVIGQYERGTVENVYDNIEADILEGLPLITNTYYGVPKYHFNVKAANAFAARFYQYKGNWEKVLEYTNNVLEEDPAGLLRQWNSDYQTLTFSETIRRYSDVIDPSNLLVVSAGSLMGRNFASLRFQLSSDLRNELFLANSNPTGKRWGYRVFGGTDLFLNIPKFEEYFRVTNQAANTGFAFSTFVLFSTDEALLNRAEAYVMLNRYDDALKDINTFLSVKTLTYNASDELTDQDIKTFYAGVDVNKYTPFYGLTQEQLPYIEGLLELRRREFHNEGLRWFDNRRFNMEITHRLSNGNQFIGEIKLDKLDNRKQVQIPEDAISFGIEPNPR